MSLQKHQLNLNLMVKQIEVHILRNHDLELFFNRIY